MALLTLLATINHSVAYQDSRRKVLLFEYLNNACSLSRKYFYRQIIQTSELEVTI